MRGLPPLFRLANVYHHRYELRFSSNDRLVSFRERSAVSRECATFGAIDDSSTILRRSPSAAGAAHAVSVAGSGGWPARVVCSVATALAAVAGLAVCADDAAETRHDRRDRRTPAEHPRLVR